MPIRPYESSRLSAAVYALLLLVSALVVLAYAPGCRVDNKPRVTVWQPPVVIHGVVPKADDDGGQR